MIIKIEIDKDAEHMHLFLGESIAHSLIRMNALSPNVKTLTDEYNCLKATITQISKSGNIFIKVSRADERIAA